MKNPNPARHHEWHAPDGQVYELIDGEPGRVFHIPPPSKAACARAKPLDPNHCALAEHWMEMEKVPIAQFGIDKCYLPVRENGKIIVYRMRVKFTRDKKRINHFDETSEWPDTEGLDIYGIPPSQRLDSRRARDKRLRERWATVGRPATTKKLVRVHLRDASRRAQVTISEKAALPS